MIPLKNTDCITNLKVLHVGVMVNDVPELLQEPTINLCQLIQPVYGVASLEGCCQYIDPLVC